MGFRQRAFAAIAGRERFQPMFTRLHRISLAGMNIGTADDVETSGEVLVLQSCLRHR